MLPSPTNLTDRSLKEASEARSFLKTTSTITRPRSPSSLDDFSSTNHVRVPAKRARKTINCGPCRLSKLKCDRERPCSSCKLRDTTTACIYQGQDTSSPGVSRTDVSSINTTIEFSKIRQALALVEAHANHIQRSPALPGSITPFQLSFDTSITRASQINDESDQSESETIPGTRGQSSRGGLYAGPTSTLSHLTTGFRDGEDDANTPHDILSTYDSDYDLCIELPPVSIIDGLVDYYFEYCDWVFRFVNHRAFMAAWDRYKSGAGADRIVLATVCMIMAIVPQYLPADHELRHALPSDTEEVGKHFYSIMRLALRRKETESRTYTLELIELHLIRVHYLMVSKIDNEEAWYVKGHAMNIATAMGLHREPGKDIPFEVAERRRWVWWSIIFIERWQALVTGRPITIRSHHFDTRLPSYYDHQVDPSGKTCNANIHLFRLSHILGDIMDDAVSLRPVPYESVLANDRKLEEWWDTLPTELNMDDYTLVDFLASPTTSKRCLGVQSLITRTAFLHIRFVMHRPYASLARSERSKYVSSLKISIITAEKIIGLSAHARPEINTTVSTHMSWCQMDSFSAAMFFCFQIINNPEQAGARHLRTNVLRAITTLDSFRGMSVAEKALGILRTLGPLYSEDFLSDTPENRERKKQAVLPAVRKLQFSSVDSLNVLIGATVEAAGSPKDKLLPTQSIGQMESPQFAGPRPDPMRGMTAHAQEPEIQSIRSQVSPATATMSQPHQHHLLHQQQQQQQPQQPTCESLPSLEWSHPDMADGDSRRIQALQSAAVHYSQTATMVASEPGGATTSPSLYAQQQMMLQAQDACSQQGPGGDDFGSGYGVGLRMVADSVLWGASGFVQGEWDRLYIKLGY